MAIGSGTYNKTNPYDKKHPAVYFRPEKFNAHVATQGVRISHEKSMLCPNVVGRLNTGEHDLNCEICDNGFVYYDKNEVFALHQDNELRHYFEINGLWEANTVMLTTPTKLEDNATDLLVHRFDRIVLLDFLVRISERLERNSASTTDLLKYKACDIERVSTAIDDNNEKVFVKDTDYELEATDGNIKWLGNDDPAEAKIYTVSYFYQPVYLVDLMLHEGRYTLDGFKRANKKAVRLPQTLLCKRDYIFEKQDSATGEDAKKPIKYL